MGSLIRFAPGATPQQKVRVKVQLWEKGYTCRLFRGDIGILEITKTLAHQPVCASADLLGSISGMPGVTECVP